MAKTYADVQAQIAKLQEQAAELRKKEVQGVLQRIQEAIAHYQLTVEDVFGTKPVNLEKPETRRGRPAAKPVAERVATKGRQPKPEGAHRRGQTRTVPIKFKDGNGNVWSGRGSQPKWLRAALASGTDLESLRVKD